MRRLIFMRRFRVSEEGMENSYDEIVNIFDLYGSSDKGIIFRGAGRFMESDEDAVDSPGVQRLIELALGQKEGPLYVIGLAAATNLASALRLCPEIVDRIVVVWLGGQPHDYETAKEFNLKQDIPAARTLFDSGVRLVHVPCEKVARKLTTTREELRAGVGGCGAIGEYLFKIFDNYLGEFEIASKTIWDIAPVAYLVNSDWVQTCPVPSPLLTDKMKWVQRSDSHEVTVATDLDSEVIFADFFAKLKAAQSRSCRIIEHKMVTASRVNSVV